MNRYYAMEEEMENVTEEVHDKVIGT